MLTFAFHDGRHCPEYFADFVSHACLRGPLTLLTPSRKVPQHLGPRPDAGDFPLRLLDPRTLPGYRDVARAFDHVFVNYSTNAKWFERACFLRWFAVNAATTTLGGDDHVCLLDTDFLLGTSPEKLLSACAAAAARQPDFIAEWDGSAPSLIGPEITIVKKSYLFDFCEYVLTTYFSPSARSRLIGEYFRTVGRGANGGISDMSALGSYAQLNPDRVFSLRRLESMGLVTNLNVHLASEAGQSDDWKITFCRDGHVLDVAGRAMPLIGTHFQGTAKVYMPLGRERNGRPGELTHAICKHHYEALLAMWRGQSVVRKAAVHVRNAYRRYFR